LARLALHEIGALSARLLLAEIEGGRQNAGAVQTQLGVQLAVRETNAPSVRTNEPSLS
jgi:DNA-binding LacI/PurR family transcriptional regulator